MSIEKCRDVLQDYLAPNGTVRLAGFSKFVTSLVPGRVLQSWEKLDDESLVRERTVKKAMAKNARIAIEAAIHQCLDDAISDHELLERLGETLSAKKMNMIKAFRKFETDNTGSLNAKEFAEGFQKCGIDISPDRAKALIAKFDVNNDGKLACWEFIRMMTASDGDDDDEQEEEEEQISGVGLPTGSEQKSPNRSNKPSWKKLVVESDETSHTQNKIAASLDLDETDVLVEFKNLILDENRVLKKTFKLLAEDGKSINAEQFMEGLTRLGCEVDADSAKRIIQKYDQDGNGIIKYFEFIKMMQNL